jgi:hypothetical protein
VKNALVPVALLLSACARPVSATAPALPAPVPGFWAHWSDNKAEMNGYRLAQPRYGALRRGTAALVFVTEPFSDALRVKADPGRHPEADVYPVLKLNAVRDFQTGIYDYNVMTSVFVRVAEGWPVAKVSFSSQEWCGHVYHHLLPRAGRVRGVLHSYFDGEADGSEDLAHPEGGIFEDALPILVRGWAGSLLSPGESRSVPFLPSLLRSRLDHRPLAWGQATLRLSRDTTRLRTPAGAFDVRTWTVTPSAGPALTFEVEAAEPYRLVRWASAAGEEATLLGSARLRYWEMNGPGGETALAQMGLRPAAHP